MTGRTAAGVPLAFGIIALAFLAFVGWLAHADLQKDRQAAWEQVTMGAIALEEHATRVFGETELLLETLAATCTGEPDATESNVLRARADNAMSSLPQLGFVGVYGAQGETVLEPAHVPAAGAYLDGFAPEHFAASRTGSHRGHVGLPFLVEPDGTQLIPFSIHVAEHADAPCAVAIAGIRASYFERFFRSFLGDKEGIALLRREPAGILVRVPEPPDPLIRTAGSPEPGRFGIEEVSSPVDGKVRLASYRKSEQYPIVMRFALTEQAIIEQWLERTLRASLPGLGVLAMLLGATLWITRLVRQAHQREQALVQANRNLDTARQQADAASRAKGRFLANMSHEVRTPLNTVVGASELLRDASLDDRQRGHVTRLSAAARSLLALIDTLLDVSRAESDHLELAHAAFDLPSLLQEVADLATASASAQGLEFRLTLDERLPRIVIGDAARLRQILINLTTNAIKFTDAGRVSLDARLEAEGDAQVTIGLTVRDTGIGMAPDQTTGIFEAFSQAGPDTGGKRHGAGLGLTISQHLARAMGSRIAVQSVPDQGSEFSLSLTLPRGDGSRLPEALVEVDAGTLAGVHILLVDDDLLGRSIEKDLLEAAGATVREATTGAEAVALCESGVRIDVLVMDVRTPEMDGLEATRTIRKRQGARLPIIGLSAEATETGSAPARAAGMDEYLSKPVDIRRLVAAILHHTGKRMEGHQ
ncbi:MAG: ATP-binding protein [Pseudomonadota bacterium]